MIILEDLATILAWCLFGLFICAALLITISVYWLTR